MANKSLANMTVEELEAVNQGLMAKRAEIKNWQHMVMAEMNKKLTAESARRKYDKLSDPEKAALTQVLSPVEIASAEKIDGTDRR